MDSQEVCQLLNITKRTLQSYRNKGIIAFSSVGGKFYYRPKDIDDICERGLKERGWNNGVGLSDGGHPRGEGCRACIAEIERVLQTAERNYRPVICGERYMTGDEVCEYLHISPRTLQTLRDMRRIPFTSVGERLIIYPESGIHEVLKENLRLVKESF